MLTKKNNFSIVLPVKSQLPVVTLRRWTLLCNQQMDTAATVDESEKKKKGWALIVHDFKQKELIPIKILSFAILASNFNTLMAT